MFPTEASARFHFGRDISRDRSVEQTTNLDFFYRFYRRRVLSVRGAQGNGNLPRDHKASSHDEGIHDVDNIRVNITPQTLQALLIFARLCCATSLASRPPLQLLKPHSNGNCGAHRGQPRAISAKICQEDGSRRRVLQKAVPAQAGQDKLGVFLKLFGAKKSPGELAMGL